MPCVIEVDFSLTFFFFSFPVTVLMYHALRLTPRYRLFAFLHVLLHKEGHTSGGFFKWQPLNFGVLHFFTGLFYGGVPYSYPIAHNKIHHAYDNDLDDVHTNLDLDRSKVRGETNGRKNSVHVLTYLLSSVFFVHLLYSSFCIVLERYYACY